MLFRLAWASVWHRKLRAVLSILAVAIGIAMMVTMLALAHGTLGEAADRMGNVDADMLVMPSTASLVTARASFRKGHQQAIEQVQLDGQRIVKEIVPVLWEEIIMAGKDQRMYGIDPANMQVFLGPRRVLQGQFPDADGLFRKALDSLRRPDGSYDAKALTPEQLQLGCELLIDQRLAVAGKYKVGDQVQALGRQWRIVGIVEPGVAGRVFCPIQTLRHINFDGLEYSVAYYVRVSPGLAKDTFAADRAASAISSAVKVQCEPLSSIPRMFEEKFGVMYAYIDVASGVAMTVCFLLILVTMYTMVVERTGQIAVLKAMGASRGLLLLQSIAEAAILSVSGTALGLGLSVVAKRLIETFQPLLTVALSPRWIVLAVLVGIVGGTTSALYPGWRAGKIEPALALQSN